MRRVLVTGASSGLGRAMAVQLGRRGSRVAITGRREELLLEAARAVEAAGGECLVLVGDVSDPEAVRKHYAEIKSRWNGLDWAILNAGVGDSKNAREFSAEDYRWTFSINVFGVAHWIEAVLPDMLAAGSGVIAGISSIAGWRGLPNSGSYCSSKAALNAMLEATRIDLIGTGVDVVTVCPGFVKSEMTDRNDPRQMPFLLETEDGAARILDGIEKRRRVVHFPWQLSYPVKYFLAHLPDGIYDWLGHKFLSRRVRRPYNRPKTIPKAY